MNWGAPNLELFTVVERRPISDELAAAAEGWLSRHGLGEQVDGRWLELVCEDGGTFRPDKLMLHLAVPPCEVAPGDSADLAGTQTVGRVWPDPDAPPEEVPKDLVLAHTFENRDDVWVGACELPAPVRELFTVENPETMLAVMNSTRRTVGGGALCISGDPNGRLSFTVVEGDIVVWGSIEARVPEAFACWLGAGPAMEFATPLEGAKHVVGGLGVVSDLIITNEQGVEARCPLDDARPAPVLLAEDHFENHAQGRVDGLRIEREGGLGRDALVAIANLRPREVTLVVADDASLLISGGPDDTERFTLEGPGFGSVEDRRNVPIVVPYVVALAMHDGAKGGTVDLTVDAKWGRLRRADQGVTVQWAR